MLWIDRAFDFFRKALKINPNIGEVNFLVGTCYLYHGLYETGIKYLSKCVKLDPYYLWAPYKLAMCYYSTGQFEQVSPTEDWQTPVPQLQFSPAAKVNILT